MTSDGTLQPFGFGVPASKYLYPGSFCCLFLVQFTFFFQKQNSVVWVFGFPQQEQCSLRLHLCVNLPENISVLTGPDFLLAVTNHCWATGVSVDALKHCVPIFSKVYLFAFLIKYEFGAKLHPTVYLRKIKCQKSCFGLMKSVQKNRAQRLYCILFFLLVWILLQ